MDQNNLQLVQLYHVHSVPDARRKCLVIYFTLFTKHLFKSLGFFLKHNLPKDTVLSHYGIILTEKNRAFLLPFSNTKDVFTFDLFTVYTITALYKT